MLIVKIENGKAVSATTQYPQEWKGHESRNDWPTMERAEQVAKELNEAAVQTVACPYIAIDSGPNVSPRYDVIERPQVGDEVSYGFNGDSYPDGKIIKVSGPNFRIITTDTGSVYYRRKLTGGWIKKGGTWSLTRGHRYEQNPSF